MTEMVLFRPDAWRYRVTARTGWPGEISSLIGNFCLKVATPIIVLILTLHADKTLRCKKKGRKEEKRKKKKKKKRKKKQTATGA